MSTSSMMPQNKCSFVVGGGAAAFQDQILLSFAEDTCWYWWGWCLRIVLQFGALTVSGEAMLEPTGSLLKRESSSALQGWLTK